MSSDIQAQIDEAERSFYDAILANDIERLAVLTSDDLIYVHSSSRVESKSQWLDEIKANHYAMKTISSSGVTTKCLGNVSIQYGTVDMSYSAGGKPVEHARHHFVLVWVKQNGKWRLSYRQGTRINN